MRGINSRRDGAFGREMGFRGGTERRNRRGDAPPTETPGSGKGPGPL